MSTLLVKKILVGETNLARDMQYKTVKRWILEGLGRATRGVQVVLGMNTRVEASRGLETILGSLTAYSLASRQVYLMESTETRLKLGIILSKVCVEKYKESLCPLSRYKISVTIMLKIE